MIKHTMNTKTNVDYGDNEGETETNYGDKSETDYGDLENGDHEDVDLEITYNNTSLPPP